MRFEGYVYRLIDPKWSWAPDSGAGSAKVGGRFNRKGQGALYTATDPMTAFREVQYGLARTQPFVVCTYEVDCEDILDLTDPEVRASFGITPAELSCDWRYQYHVLKKDPQSWLLADRLVNQGIAGIRIHSFAKGASLLDTNLVFWAWSESLPHQVKVIDDHKALPQNQDSWNQHH